MTRHPNVARVLHPMEEDRAFGVAWDEQLHLTIVLDIPGPTVLGVGLAGAKLGCGSLRVAMAASSADR